MVFGQTARSRWDVLLHGSVINRFLNEVRDVTVQVVPMQRQAVAQGVRADSATEGSSLNHAVVG